jgi:hypothetical protein
MMLINIFSFKVFTHILLWVGQVKINSIPSLGLDFEKEKEEEKAAG